MNIIMEGLRINFSKKMNEIYLKTAAIDQLFFFLLHEIIAQITTHIT